jgi:hypothetical protein
MDADSRHVGPESLALGALAASSSFPAENHERPFDRFARATTPSSSVLKVASARWQ